jgi:hypothetical protein
VTAKITFFPVGNGDMTLLRLESGRTLLIDCRIRAAADDADDDTRDVAADLRERLDRDAQNRLFVDAFLQTHPDADHCTGLSKHFHFGPPTDYNAKDDKIFIREVWSSPIVFRRASKNHVLCDDAKAFVAEARRRVKRFRDTAGVVEDGDRIQILGEDVDGKTDDLTAILIRVDETITKINGTYDGTFSAYLLAPLASDDEADEDVLSKNCSSVILQFNITGDAVANACLFLTGGDAEVVIWERLWQKHKNNAGVLQYDLLETPHHCSWHSLSYDSWSELGEDAEVNQDARSALGQAKKGASIIATSNAIKDDDNDPPCIRAKREYTDIVARVQGLFYCGGEEPNEAKPEPLEFHIGQYGPSRQLKRKAGTGTLGAIGSQPLSHG